MKIVNIEEIFHAAAGYQVNVLSKFLSSRGHDVYIIATDKEHTPKRFLSFFGDDIEKSDAEYTKKYGVHILRMPIYGYVNRKTILKFGLLKYMKVLKYIRDEIKPDILFVHGNEQTISLLAILMYKYMNMPYILDDHMVAMAMEGRKRWLFYKAIRTFISPIIIRNDLTDIRTQNEDFIQKYIGVPEHLSPWISIGSDTTLFYPDEHVKHDMRIEYGLSDDDIVFIYAGKLDRAKGADILDRALSWPFGNGKIKMIIVGNTTQDEFGEGVESSLGNSPCQIIRFPTQKYEELAKYYQMADIGVFPRQCSLSIYDMMACGLAIISEDNNINAERLSHENGVLFQSGSPDDLHEKMEQMSQQSRQALTVMKSNATQFVKEHYDYASITQQYEVEMEKSIRRFEERKKR